MMDQNTRRDSNVVAEEIQVLGAISLVSARLARRLAALANQRQSVRGAKTHEQNERFSSDYRGTH